MKLQNKIAVITGGNSGIGLAIAEQFREEGARVVIFGRNAETLAKAGETLGESAVTVQGDVSRLEDLDRLYEEVAKIGKVDVLVVNAGIANSAPMEQIDETVFDQVSDVNFKGAFFTIQKAIPHFGEGASVILTSSAVQQKGMPGFSVYAATKAAVRSLARTLTAELLPKGVRVNVLSPGPIETPIFDRMGLPAEAMEGMASQITSMVPMGRFGAVKEMASAATFLASSDSSYVAGAELVADGGLSAL